MDLLRRRRQFFQGIYHNDEIHYAPKDRIDSLYKSLPCTHPLNDLVQELYSSLSQPFSLDTSNDQEFLSTITKISQVLHCHKLHSQILSQAVSLSYTYTPPNKEIERSYHTTTDEYVGNVLIATYLFSNLDVIDGGIRVYSLGVTKLIHSELHWFRLLYLQLKLDPQNVHHWYSAWIVLHSSLLRFLPTHAEQQTRLGLCFSSFHIMPQGQYKFLTKFPLIPLSCRTRSELSRIIIGIRDIMQIQCKSHYSFRDFGPLGPAFRGRDHLRRLSIDFRLNCTILQGLIQFVEDHQEDSITSTSFYKEFFFNDDHRYQRFWLDAVVNLEWIYNVYYETFKQRPMTVSTPTIHFEVVIT